MRIFFKGFCRLSLVCFKNMNRCFFGSEELSVFLPLTAHKLINEIVEEGQRSTNPSWQRYEKTGWVTPVCRYPPWYPFQEEVTKERKREKKNPKTCKCCYVWIARGNLSCDQCCFCRRRLVYLPLYLSSFKWARFYIGRLENKHLFAFTLQSRFLYSNQVNTTL